MYTCVCYWPDTDPARGVSSPHFTDEALSKWATGLRPPSWASNNRAGIRTRANLTTRPGLSFLPCLHHPLRPQSLPGLDGGLNSTFLWLGELARLSTVQRDTGAGCAEEGLSLGNRRVATISLVLGKVTWLPHTMKTHTAQTPLLDWSKCNHSKPLLTSVRTFCFSSSTLTL